MNHISNSAGIALATAGRHKPTVNIASFDLAGPGMARVTCSVSHAGDSREDHSLVMDELRARFGGKMEAVAGSFRSLDSGPFQEQITGIVAVVREAMHATPENLKGFKSVSSNMFMDEEEHMWVVRHSAAGDLVVKTTGIDDDMSLVNLLNQACAGATSLSSLQDHRRMVATASAIGDAVEGGAFVSYVDHNNTIAHGYVVATAFDEANPDVLQAIVLPAVGDEKEAVINVKAVTEIHPQDSFPVVQVSEQEVVDNALAAARGTTSLQTLLDFYKRVYSRSPKFYAEFARRLKQHAFA